MNFRKTSSWKMSALGAAIGLVLGGAATAQQSQSSQDRSQSQSQAQQRSQSQSNQSQPQAQQRSQSQDQSQAQAAQRSQSQQGSQQQRGGQSADNAQMSFDKVAQQHSNLSEFVSAVKSAGLADSLASGDTKYTIFAPTNDAFKDMKGKSVDELMQPQNQEQLVSLLRAHIVADDIDLAQARNLPGAKTIDGGTVDLETENGTLMVGDAKIVDKNPITVSENVTIYPIDQVLESKAAAAASNRSGSSPQASNRGASPQASNRDERSGSSRSNDR